MPLDFTKPALADNYSTGVLPSILQAFSALAQMLDPAVAGTLTSIPTGAYRINGLNLERYSGSAWTTYTLNIAGSAAQLGGLSLSANVTTATASQVPRVSSDGTTYLGPIASATANGALASPAQFVTNNGTDNLYQRSTPTQASAAIQAVASGTWSINISGNAGSATSVAYTGVTGRPTALSAFTNDVGFITSASTVAGLAPAASASVPGTNQLIRTETNGYTYTGYIVASHTASEVASPAQFIVGNGTDNFYRRSSAAQVTSTIQGAASGTWAISVTGNAATASAVAWTGVAGRPTNVSAFTNDSGYLRVYEITNSPAIGSLATVYFCPNGPTNGTWVPPNHGILGSDLYITPPAGSSGFVNSGDPGVWTDPGGGWMIGGGANLQPMVGNLPGAWLTLGYTRYPTKVNSNPGLTPTTMTMYSCLAIRTS